MKAQLVEAYRGRLLEGPMWHEDEQSLRFVDIKKGILYRYHPKTKETTTISFDENVTFVAPTTDQQLLVSTRNALWFVDPKTGHKEKFVQFTDFDDALRFNDGGIDPFGRLWIGTMNEDEQTPNAKLYVVDATGHVHVAKEGLTISNGLAWNKKGDTMYAIDTPTEQVRAYPFDAETLTLGEGHVVYDFKEVDGSPDGMTIDANDHLWVALWGGRRIECIDPTTSDIVETVALPVANITSCAFQPGTSNLYITTASEGLTDTQKAAQQDAGSLFKTTTNETAAPIYRFEK
ncbi:SMP-30/gluconolactonase/LRE family protein [Kurthia massiliensis]|uniref:SMP-30/gluconolactonase/LRE family protein n=1 Tax=Kurthia massiliensis TaxID=1033739 RepID=UPI00028A2F89|nr:SMP-30/gluconolactonase/LRE family protein [Kurthia massiliensis]